MPKLVEGRLGVANELKRNVAIYWCRKNYGVNFEFGVNKGGSLRADVFAMNLYGYIIITEVKSCVADFDNDFKWEQYLKYCNKFYFAFDEKTWKKLKGRVPRGIGVMVMTVNSQGRGKMRVVQNAKHEQLDIEYVHNLALRAAYRGAKYRNPKELNKSVFYTK